MRSHTYDDLSLPLSPRRLSHLGAIATAKPQEGNCSVEQGSNIAIPTEGTLRFMSGQWTPQRETLEATSTHFPRGWPTKSPNFFCVPLKRYSQKEQSPGTQDVSQIYHGIKEDVAQDSWFATCTCKWRLSVLEPIIVLLANILCFLQ